MLTSTKLYVQLSPDDTGVLLLQSIQDHLDKATTRRLVPSRSMHLTVLHIGLVSRLLDSLRPYSDTPDDTILVALDNLVETWTYTIRELHFDAVDLTILSSDLFGVTNATLVLRLSGHPSLSELHTRCLQDFIYFLERLGINDPVACMAADDNLKHGLSLVPHISIAKGYSGQELKSVPEQTIGLGLMPLVYEEDGRSIL